MAKRPLYSKIQESPEFNTREKAASWAKDQKKLYKQAGTSLRYDVKRTDAQNWRAVVSAKV